MAKRATRYLACVYDPNDIEVGDMLVQGNLNWLQLLLPVGYTVRRPPPKVGKVVGPIYSPHDPINSIIGAMQFRRWMGTSTQAVWQVLFDAALRYDVVPRDTMVALVGASEATRRFRQIRRELHWPVDCRSRGKGPWIYFMELTAAQRTAALRARGQNVRVMRRRRRGDVA